MKQITWLQWLVLLYFLMCILKLEVGGKEQVCVQTYAIMAEIQNFVNSETPRLKYNSKAIHGKRPTLKWLTLAPANPINTKRYTRAVQGAKHLKLRSGVEALQWSLLVIVLSLLVVTLP